MPSSKKIRIIVAQYDAQNNAYKPARAYSHRDFEPVVFYDAADFIAIYRNLKTDEEKKIFVERLIKDTLEGRLV